MIGVIVNIKTKDEKENNSKKFRRN